MGISDFQPDRQILDFPKDILVLADRLNIERFSVLAYPLAVRTAWFVRSLFLDI